MEQKDLVKEMCLRKPRQSNIELLRIVAMFFVLVIHANYATFGIPTHTDVVTSPASSYFSLLINAASIVGVNVFVLISGWFGIKPKRKGISKFLFQCLFYSIGIYVAFIIIGQSKFSKHGIAECLFLLPDDYWFVKAYIGLYVLSPLLNIFVDNISKMQFKYILLGFFAFEFYFGWINESATFIKEGYSTLSFIGLYLLARYARLYPNRLCHNKATIDLLIFAGFIICSAAIMLLVIPIGSSLGKFLALHCMSYDSPIVIGSSFYLLLCFSKLKMQSRFINWIAASSFAVYLIHCHPEIFASYFVTAIVYIKNNYNICTSFLLTSLLLIVIFMLSVMMDQIRIAVWHIIERKFIPYRSK